MNEPLKLFARSLSPESPKLVDTALGKTLEIRSRSRNLFDREFSLGQSVEGLQSKSPIDLVPDDGFAGPGHIVWKPSQRGASIEIELPSVRPTDYITTDGTGIFVAMCLSLRVKTEVGLSLSMEGTNADETEATPGFASADSESWQRMAVALRAVGDETPKAELIAHGAGEVRIDALQFDPRTYPVWMVTEPMRTGMWGNWTEGGTQRENETCWIELNEGDIQSSGAISAWVRPDWPSSEFPHTVFDAGFETLFLAFNNARVVGAAGGCQIGINEHGQDWRNMVRFEPGRWQHVALAWEDNGEVGFFVNGECYSRRQIPTALKLNPERLGSRIYIGCPSQADGYQQNADMPGRFDGSIADVQVHHGNLDDADVAMLHLEGRQKLDIAVPEAIEVKVGPHEVVRKSSFYCWFPNKLGKMPDGSIEMFAAGGPDYGPKPDYWPDSRKNFRKSSPDAPWVPFDEDFYLGGEPQVLPDGRMLTWAIDHRDNHEVHQGVFTSYVTSTDGENWKPFDAVIDLPEHESFRISQIMVDSTERVLACGSIQLKGWTRNNRSVQDALFGPVTGHTELFMAESHDSGRTFQFLSFITEGKRPPVGDYCEENAIIEILPEESSRRSDKPELLFICRVRGHMVPCIQMRSVDGGRNWSAPELCPFGAVFPRLVRLTNRLIVLIVGRPETVLHWTSDGGETWSPPLSLYDSREQPVQSENIWYGPSTGYGSMSEMEPNKLWVAYDQLGAYDAELQERVNRVCVREVSFSKVDSERTRIELEDFQMTGEWKQMEGTAAWTACPDARAELEFTGTGIVLTHPLLRHGGILKTTIDGATANSVNCYDPLPHHATGTTVLASGLAPGTHTLVLEPDLTGKDRHAHGNGAELSGTISWLHLAHTQADRWVGFCGAEVIG